MTKRRQVSIAAFALPVLCLCLLFAIRGIYPFGGISNMADDMEVQYADLFAWYRRLLLGQSGPEYSFSMSIGMPTAAVLGYYLLSPVNLLVLFFPPEGMQLCFFVISAVKLGLSGLFFSLYVRGRVRADALPALTLSLAYAFGQYTVGQMTNILWLDGVYMLPLILLGIWRWVEKRRGWLLLLSMALSIVFNWYTGYMNGLFAVFYFLFEMAYTPSERRAVRGAKGFAGFFAVMALSVGVSAAVFLPVALGQMAGRSADMGVTLVPSFSSTAMEILNGLHLGHKFPDSKITPFCSVWALIFFFAMWFDRGLSARKKLACAGLVGWMIFSEAFAPMSYFWCALKLSGSYVYRFHYLLQAAMLIASAETMVRAWRDGPAHAKPLAWGAGLYALTLLVTHLLMPYADGRVYWELGLIALYALLPLARGVGPRRAAAASVGVLLLAETVWNAYLLRPKAYVLDAYSHPAYAAAQQALVGEVRALDGGSYRMEQDTNRPRESPNPGLYNSMFYANEAMAYGYQGLQTYTSCYMGDTARFMSRLGYCRSVFPTVYKAPLLMCDSLLGMKYLLTGKEPYGYEPTGIEGNGKAVYLNPYALPLAFGANEAVLEADGGQSGFGFINQIYNAIRGIEDNILREVELDEGVPDFQSVYYDLPPEASGEDTLLYAVFDPLMVCSVYIDGEKRFDYWSEYWDHNDFIALIGPVEEYATMEIYIDDVRWPMPVPTVYALNLPHFAQVIEEIRQGAAQVERFADDGVRARYAASADGYVLFTIPYDTGWRAWVNGKEARPLRAAEALMAVPVGSGESVIELRYGTRGRWAGLAISALSLAAFAIWQAPKSWKKKKQSLQRE